MKEERIPIVHKAPAKDVCLWTRPSFVTFYNGTEKQPERVEFKLSDLYERTSGNEESYE